ncbi:signal peptide peptidase SppA [Sandaracinus amylolyticus]|uniref:signal peptide peptidase SppA n=1 Tax=Sandaracinus amylolyticus TaxID=927083 RepID=UPI001F026CAB|nr:signal peptide peptidase SppA [Sandaracinus amylolyticus]UJR79772.1 Signal peptide peptidase SppA [Sandaracinus amylolyticus]
MRRALSSLTALFVLACGGDPAALDTETDANPARRELREIVLLAPPSESAQPTFFEAPQPALRDVVQRIDDARTDEHVVSLFLRLGPMGGAWGRIDDLREALQAVRDAGKPVHCHFETIDNAGYLLAASACDRITVTPAGMLDTVGVAAQVFYARSLLDSIGVSADLLQVGSFKGAAEPFTRQDMSPEMRESLGTLLDDLQSGLVQAMVSGRGMEAAHAQQVLDAGPYDSAAALEAHLVDAIEYDDEARTRAREAGGATRNVRVRLTPEPEDVTLGDLLGALTSGEPPESEAVGPHIVLAYLDGEITDAEESGTGTGQSGPFVRRMRELAEDEDVRAVVLRIDSPGGSALASDRMWHAVRRIAGRKPVIVSVGDMAASGGYYIASAGHDIVAHPASIVGSIGVVGGKVDASALMSRLGVHAETITRGAHAGWSSPSAPFTDEERAVLRRIMESTYRRFVRRVSEGREMPEERVLASAEGRIWSGRQGLERGLVDRLGGLGTAIAMAREQASLPEDTQVVEWPARRTMIETLMHTMQGGDPAEDAAAALVRAELGPAADALRWARFLRADQPVVLALPIGLDVR